MQFAAAEPFPNRTRLRLRFRRHRRQGIDPKFFDSWSVNGVLGDYSREVGDTSTIRRAVVGALCRIATCSPGGFFVRQSFTFPLAFSRDWSDESSCAKQAQKRIPIRM